MKPPAPTRSGTSRISNTILRSWLPPVVCFGIVVVVWQIVAAHEQYVLPSLSVVLRQFGDAPHLYLSNAATTLEEALIGTAASCAVALGLAIAMHHARFLERALMPLAVVVNVTPVIAIAPALIIAYGFGELPKVLVTALVTFFPFLVNALVGLRSTGSGEREVFETLHASRREVLWHLELPSSLPYLFAAARVCLPLSIVGAVVAEFVIGGNELGLGSVIASSYANTDLPPIYASVLALAFMGVVLTAIVVFAERRLLSWHTSQRRGELTFS